MKTDELRKLYLEFFCSKEHRVFSSDSLVPANDPSLLFTGAGMNQFKSYFLGQKKDVRRATSCQKCLRTADLDRVGKTATHHTFFEMLGNFSFGDYFKEEAIAWGWEFVTKRLALSPSKLWVSVYEKDDEAFGIWKNKIGLSESRIVRMGAVDNFWPSNAKADGPNGPCGPCSEIYSGEVPGKGVEIWNLVFTQFDRRPDGSLENLPQKNIDTGMGLERTAAVLQGVASNFDTDNFQIIRAELRRLLDKSKRPLNEKIAIAHENAVMDHARAAVFSIADGALPSNEGRGYVIRKLIRLGTDHLEKAGAAHSGKLHQLTAVITGTMRAAYPELIQSEKNIAEIIKNEEKAFLDVLTNRVPALRDEFSRAKAGLEKIAFLYQDSYGVPLELSEGIASEFGLSIDRGLFEQMMGQQRERSRGGSKIAGEIFSKDQFLTQIEGLPPTNFLGYECTQSSAKLLRVIDGELLIFDQSPFYAESGGQIGDTGEIRGKNVSAKVLDTQWLDKCIAHRVEKLGEAPTVGESYDLTVDADRRLDIMKNHTATHLLHSALRHVLGDHIKQAGSLVAADHLRFDFTHFGGIDAEKLAAIEAMVNSEINKNIILDKSVMGKEEAIQKGAVAFFGEKYGSQVRVITIGDFSKELCGGTHLRRTAEIELFKIISEGSIQSGVRRIEALTGHFAKQLVDQQRNELAEMALCFASEKSVLSQTLKNQIVLLGGLERRLKCGLDSRLRINAAEDLKHAPDLSGVRFLEQRIPGLDVEGIKSVYEYLKSLKCPFVAIIISPSDEKVSFAVAASSQLSAKGFHAGNIVKAVAQVLSGSGGGRPEFALGGGKSIEKLEEAVVLAKKMIAEVLRNTEKGISK